LKEIQNIVVNFSEFNTDPEDDYTRKLLKTKTTLHKEKSIKNKPIEEKTIPKLFQSNIFSN
jgi:hypothetical protein